MAKSAFFPSSMNVLEA